MVRGHAPGSGCARQTAQIQWGGTCVSSSEKVRPPRRKPAPVRPAAGKRPTRAGERQVSASRAGMEKAARAERCLMRRRRGARWVNAPPRCRHAAAHPNTGFSAAAVPGWAAAAAAYSTPVSRLSDASIRLSSGANNCSRRLEGRRASSPSADSRPNSACKPSWPWARWQMVSTTASSMSRHTCASCAAGTRAQACGLRASWSCKAVKASCSRCMASRLG